MEYGQGHREKILRYKRNQKSLRKTDEIITILTVAIWAVAFINPDATRIFYPLAILWTGFVLIGVVKAGLL